MSEGPRKHLPLLLVAAIDLVTCYPSALLERDKPYC